MGLRLHSCKTQSLGRVGKTFVSGKSKQIIHRFEKQSWSHRTIIDRVKCQPSRSACALGTGSTRAVKFAQQKKPLLTATSKLPCYQANRKTKYPQFLHNAILRTANASHLEQMDWEVGGGGRQQVTIVRANRVTRPHATIARRPLKKLKGSTNFRKNFQYHISQKPVRPSSGCCMPTATDRRTDGRTDGDILKASCRDAKAQKCL